MPSELVLKLVNAIHRPLFQLSKGKIAGKGAGMPVLRLITIGRTGGLKRSTMLTTPLQIDDRIMIVASRGGDDRNPDWFLNLQANPAVEVEMGGATRTMTARVANPAEKAELWPRIIGPHANYAGYQTKTDRDIPVVVLSP
ncbi:MAG: nitroreductase family deazaflavin-dependent oxidoreductase [Acidimicrobiia bacterium]|nr:nitroreductase family deazaflavin-dependent oxidoreductase [Acidimicrobiia bacterium]